MGEEDKAWLSIKTLFDGAEIEHVDIAGKEKQVKVTDSGTFMLKILE